ncbi:MAG: hypothetical protein ACYCXR_08660 [Coriobacteriia bacterium]
MLKRSLWFLLAFTLILALASGCSPGATQPAEPDSVEITEPAGEPVTDPEPADSGAPTALPLETDGEKNAAQTAESDESRTWASGDTVNGTPVPGEPFLVGYGILLHDGTTQYQVRVLNGEVVGAFGKTAEPRLIEAPFANFNPTIGPDSARQTEAVETAKDEIAFVNPNATQGGIEFYVFFYPPIDEGQFPEVCLLASPTESASPQTMGGTYGWR